VVTGRTIRAVTRQRPARITWEDRPPGRPVPARVAPWRAPPGPEAEGGVLALLLRPRGSPPIHLRMEPQLVEV